MTAIKVWLLGTAFVGVYCIARFTACGGAPPTPKSVTLVRADGGFLVCTDFAPATEGDASRE